MIRVTFDRDPPPPPPTLFTPGMAWEWAARAWADEMGLTVERVAIDQRFFAGDTWRSITWNDATEEWDVQPEAPDADDLGDRCGQCFPDEPPAAPPDYPPAVLRAHRRRLTG
jgi:hypothetical protein